MTLQAFFRVVYSSLASKYKESEQDDSEESENSEKEPPKQAKNSKKPAAKSRGRPVQAISEVDSEQSSYDDESMDEDSEAEGILDGEDVFSKLDLCHVIKVFMTIMNSEFINAKKMFTTNITACYPAIILANLCNIASKKFGSPQLVKDVIAPVCQSINVADISDPLEVHVFRRELKQVQDKLVKKNAKIKKLLEALQTKQ